MAKKPRNTPKVRDRVKLRGRESYGELIQHNTNDWCQVAWVTAGPVICHLYELEKLDDDFQLPQ